MSEPLIIEFGLITFLLLTLGGIKATRLSVQTLTLALVGIITGLLLGALVSIPLASLPNPYGNVLPIVVSLIVTILSTAIVVAQRNSILGLIPALRIKTLAEPALTAEAPDEILVDTSVIIDGRVADIAKAGFIRAKLLIPRFVLAELQNIADSDDAMRRGRGRRGLEVLQAIRETSGLETEIIEAELPEIKEVDAKLVALAQQRGCDVLTTDFNLNRVAQIQGVRVLNINELANAIRPVVIPGEQMLVRIVQAGKEKGQGVGYLADGTMIVVDQGDKLIGQEIPTEVTRVFQTVAGKMIFAVPLDAIKPDKPTSAPRPPRDKQVNKPAPEARSASAKSSHPKASRGAKPANHRLRPQSQIEDSLIAQTNGNPPE